MKQDERFGLSSKTISALKSVFSKYPQIERVIIYGSRAKGNFRPGSDIDLTLVAPSLNLTELLKIENEIEELMLPYKIDLSLRHTIENQELLEHLDRVGIEF
jgi:predicted nucleotidyltransferase